MISNHKSTKRVQKTPHMDHISTRNELALYDFRKNIVQTNLISVHLKTSMLFFKTLPSIHMVLVNNLNLIHHNVWDTTSWLTTELNISKLFPPSTASEYTQLYSEQVQGTPSSCWTNNAIIAARYWTCRNPDRIVQDLHLPI